MEIDNMTNRLSRNFIESSKLQIGVFAGLVKLSNFFSLFVSKLRLALNASSFLNHILGIVFGGPKKEMIGVHAQPNIALMTKKHTLWNFINKQLPGVSVSSMFSWISSVAIFISVKNAVAGSAFGAIPKPATVWAGFINFVNESLKCAFVFHCHPAIMPDDRVLINR